MSSVLQNELTCNEARVGFRLGLQPMRAELALVLVWLTTACKLHSPEPHAFLDCIRAIQHVYSSFKPDFH